jgi:hypothetical protein
MPFTHDEWHAIQVLVSKSIEEQGEYFVQDIVVKSDPVNGVIWTKEFGDQAIPLFTFDYQVKYYDTQGTALIPKKTTAYSKEVVPLTPRKGDVVLIARHLGARRLPKCLGVLKSKNFISESGE